MLTQNFRSGNYLFEPTGRTLTYNSRGCQEISVSEEPETKDMWYSRGKMLAPLRATRAQVLAQYFAPAQHNYR